MGVKPGDWIIAKAMVFETDLDGELLVYALPGAIGHVLECRPGFLPTILWERSGMVCDADPETDFDFLCGPEFGRDPPQIPKQN